jgi:hypothetical protein
MLSSSLPPPAGAYVVPATLNDIKDFALPSRLKRPAGIISTILTILLVFLISGIIYAFVYRVVLRPNKPKQGASITAPISRNEPRQFTCTGDQLAGSLVLSNTDGEFSLPNPWGDELRIDVRFRRADGDFSANTGLIFDPATKTYKADFFKEDVLLYMDNMETVTVDLAEPSNVEAPCTPAKSSDRNALRKFTCTGNTLAGPLVLSDTGTFPNRVPIVLAVRRGILAQRTRPKFVVGERDGGTVLLPAYRIPTQPEL